MNVVTRNHLCERPVERAVSIDMLCTSVVLQLSWRVLRISTLVDKLESTVFKKKRSMEQDLIFINPYRKRKSDEDQSLEVSETELVFSTFGRKAIYRTKKREYSWVLFFKTMS